MSELLPEIGVYYDGQSSKSAPAYFMDIETARSHKRTGTGHFINHGKAIRISQRKSPEVPDNRLLLAGGSMRDSWTVMKSGGFLVWQMPGMAEVNV